MKRLRYVLGMLDRRDAIVLSGVAVAALVIAFGCGVVTARHRERAERERLDAKAHCEWDGRNTPHCLMVRSGR